MVRDIHRKLDDEDLYEEEDNASRPISRASSSMTNSDQDDGFEDMEEDEDEVEGGIAFSKSNMNTVEAQKRRMFVLNVFQVF